MIAVCFLACLALTSAAPQYSLQFGPASRNSDFFSPGIHRGYDHDDIFSGEVFDTKRFWQELEAEMQRFDHMLEDFYKHFPKTTSEAGIQGNEYVVAETLTGFDEDDIKVKAKEGILMIQAIHKTDDGTSQSSYLDLKTLPSYVNVNGSWTFERGLLKIVFPLKSRPEDITSAPVTTAAPEIEDRSREEMDNSNNVHTQDADVGLVNANNKEQELLTNVIPQDRNTVEATTYAVDLKNEVEFVPVKY